VKARN